jgi:hypothetical protein
MGLLRTVWTAIKLRIVWFVLTAAVIAGAVFIFGPRSKTVDRLRRVLAGRALEEVIRDIERRYVQHEIRKRLAVLDFSGEKGGFIADLLRNRLRKKGMLVETRKSVFQKALAAVGISGPTDSSEKAAKLAEKLGADGAVFGRVEEFSSDGDRGAVRLEVAVADAKSAKEVMRSDYASVWPAGALDRIRTFGAGWRLLIWLAVTVLLPLAAYPIARAALERESNALTFALLLVLTALDVFAVLVLLGFSVPNLWAALLVCGALGAAAVYNYLVFNSYEKMRA